MSAIDTIKAIQSLLLVTPDGDFGKKSRASLEALIAAAVKKPLVITDIAVPGMEFDERTEKNLATLNEKSRPLFRAFMRDLIPYMAAKGVVAKIISGTRTFEEQDALYAKGRTAPGPKVTNAKAGQSNHNYGCACDIGLFKDGDYLEDSPLYLEAGPIGQAAGLSWGGAWPGKFKDLPHFDCQKFRAPAHR